MIGTFSEVIREDRALCETIVIYSRYMSVQQSCKRIIVLFVQIRYIYFWSMNLFDL